MEKRELDAMISPLRGRIGFYYENLIDGTTLGYNEDETFGAASVIKLPVLMYTAKLVAEGELSWEQKVTVRDEDKKPSCGALLSMTGDIETDLISLCRLMITISDNTATNMVIRTVGMERLQKRIHRDGTCQNQSHQRNVRYKRMCGGSQQSHHAGKSEVFSGRYTKDLLSVRKLRG